MIFAEKDKQQILDHGLTLDGVTEQIEKFKSGFPPTQLVKAAIVGEGIVKLSEDEIDTYIKEYESQIGTKSIVKFVPASGAASRMFKKLFAFIEEYKGSDSDYEKLSSDQTKGSMFQFFKELEKFAFYQDLKAVMKDETLEEKQLKKQYVAIVKQLLTAEGLNYGSLPKGLLKFHDYSDGARTPVEEHLVEGAQYAKDAKGKVQIHFTVSPEHQELFEKHVSDVLKGYEEQFGASYDISYSQQKDSTDTIAVDLQNEPTRNADGSLLFRPAGHGALLENLNEIDADIIFLKNIDNVVPDRLKDTTVTYKKVLAGVLLEYQAKLATALNDDDASVEGLLTLVKELGYHPGSDFDALADDKKKTYLLAKLQRPLRVCGMVKNDGDTGGGPFWVSGSAGARSLQVVETAQVDLTNESQKAIFSQSTHFNPVDVVCSTKTVNGEKIDLMKFRDLSTGFISSKSKDGKDLKAMELPGLWNGSMADWNTLFVEVPLITFNPVKSVTDLLEAEHQG